MTYTHSLTKKKKNSLDADAEQLGPEYASLLDEMLEGLNTLPTHAYAYSYSSVGYQHADPQVMGDGWGLYTGELTYDGNDNCTNVSGVVGAYPYPYPFSNSNSNGSGEATEYDFSDADCDW